MSEPTKSNAASRRRFTAILAGMGAAAPLLAQQQTTSPPATPAPTPAAGLPVQGASPQRPGRPADIPPFQGPIEFARKDVAPKVRPFPMTQVRVLAGPFQDALEWNRGYMSRLPADRLTHNFQLNAGLPSSAKPLGGWEEYVDPKRPRTNQDGELRGHFTGHFLSASAQLWASTGDKEAKAKGDEMVDILAKCQAKLPGGYLSAFPTEFFDRLDARRPVWAPFYTVHKIMAGMFDMYRYAGNKQALEVVSGMADWADSWTASKSEEHMQDILRTEYGGMGEVLYNLAAETGNEKWAKAGDRYAKKSFFNPLASRRDELRGLHVNTHIPQVIAAARRYEISGDYRFHDMADYFWDEVVSARSYVTMGTSNDEGWQSQPRQLAWELKNTGVRNGSQPATNTAECCCAYNMLKLTRHLYSWTAQPRYFDYYERSLLNHRLGTIEPKTGHTQYYLSLALSGAHKEFNSEFDDFWCCTGTGVEEYSKLSDSIYWRDEQGVYVNLFIASELNWEEKGFKLRQDTRFPQQPGTALVITAAKPVPMAMRLRVPAWLASAPVVKLNGKAIDASAEPGSYLTLARVWKAGDRVEMELPMRLSMETLPDDPSLQAFLYGPVVLAADLGAAPPRREGEAPQQRPRPEAPVFKAGADPTSWVKPGDAPLAFHTSGQTKDYPLVPLNSIFDKRYLVYLKVT